MVRWLCIALRLLAEVGAARRDARVCFLKAQVEILRRKLGGNRVSDGGGRFDILSAYDGRVWTRDGDGWVLKSDKRATTLPWQ
jgi:hypothetical protein